MDYEEISTIAGRIINGTATITRLDQEEERGRIAGGRRNVEAAIVLGTAFATDQSEQSGSLPALNELSALQKTALKQYAEQAEQKEEKLWYSEVDIENLKKQAIAQSGGAEADVFFMTDGYVIKIVEHNSFPLEFLDDRISLYNYLFPETSYELIGFTDNPFDADFVSFIVRQKEIEGDTLLKQLKTVSRYPGEERKEAENNLQEAIVRHLKEKFDATPAYTSNTYSNSNYIIRDLHFENVMAVGNVLTNPQEHLYIIDANVSLNTDKKNGGIREYQPFMINNGNLCRIFHA